MTSSNEFSLEEYYAEDTSKIFKNPKRVDPSRSDYYFLIKHEVWLVSCLHELDDQPKRGRIMFSFPQKEYLFNLFTKEDADVLALTINSFLGMEEREDLELYWAICEYKKNIDSIKMAEYGDLRIPIHSRVVMIKFENMFGDYFSSYCQLPWIDWGTPRRSFNHAILSDHKVHYFFDQKSCPNIGEKVFWKYWFYAKDDDYNSWYKYSCPVKAYNNCTIEYTSPAKLNPIGLTMQELKRKRDVGVARARKELDLLLTRYSPFISNILVLSIRAAFSISLSNRWRFSSLYILPGTICMNNMIDLYSGDDQESTISLHPTFFGRDVSGKEMTLLRHLYEKNENKI